MERKSVLLIVAVVAGLVVLSAGVATATAETNGDLTVDVTQNEDGTAVVTVTENETAVANASVTVEVEENQTYVGVGNYSTDENGSVDLPAPENDSEVTIFVSAEYDNATAQTEATLSAESDDAEDAPRNFGQAVSEFVQNLTNDNETEGPIGYMVSNFVLDNNPAAEKIPAHAGPPENVTGPPDHAGPSDNQTGPPDHAGPSDNETGPPEHAGSGGDSGPTDSDDPEDGENTEDETEESE